MDNMEPASEKPLNHSYLCGLDPLFHTYVNVFIRTIHKLTPASEDESCPIRFFRFSDAGSPRPIRLVMIGGLIVSSATYNKVSCVNLCLAHQA